MNIISLWARVREGHYDVNLDVEAPYLPKDYVFDENITIAENRRRIEVENSKIQKKRIELLQEQNKYSVEFEGDLFKFLVNTFGISDEQARGCLDWAYNEAKDSSPGARFVTFVKAVRLLSCFYNKDVCGLYEIPY